MDDVTQAERLWVWRKNRKLTQADAAERFGVGERLYRDIELGKLESGKMLGAGKWADEVRAEAITEQMALRLCRRRAGWGSRNTAMAAGFGTHVALLKAEKMADATLIAFWCKKGVYKPAAEAQSLTMNKGPTACAPVLIK